MGPEVDSQRLSGGPGPAAGSDQWTKQAGPRSLTDGTPAPVHGYGLRKRPHTLASEDWLQEVNVRRCSRSGWDL